MTKNEWNDEVLEVGAALQDDQHVLKFVKAVLDLNDIGVFTEVSLHRLPRNKVLKFFLNMDHTPKDENASQYLKLLKTIIALTSNAKTRIKDVIHLTKQMPPALHFLISAWLDRFKGYVRKTVYDHMTTELREHMLPLLVDYYLTESAGQHIMQFAYVVALPNGLNVQITPEYHASLSNYMFAYQVQRFLANYRRIHVATHIMTQQLEKLKKHI